MQARHNLQSLHENKNIAAYTKQPNTQALTERSLSVLSHKEQKKKPGITEEY